MSTLSLVHSAKSTINLDALPPDAVCAEALAALHDDQERLGLHVRDGHLVIVRSREDGSLVIRDVTRKELVAMLMATVHFVRAVRGQFTAVPPPGFVVETIRGMGDWPIRRLVAISPVPVLRADGSVSLARGFDEPTGIFQSFAVDLQERVPAQPSQADVADARARLLDIIAEFPFADEASRANAVGLMLTSFVRTAVDAPTPLQAISANSQGSGKTLLASACCMVATGQPPAILAEPENDAETRKRLTGIVQSGETIAVIDNVTGAVCWDSLAAMLTTKRWSDRLVGTARIVRAENRCTWIVTGNSLQLAGDIARRTVLIRLESLGSRPQERSGFRHPDLLDWIAENLSDLQAAATTLCLAWGQAGMPSASTPVIGGFERWSRIVGGILEFAGIPGFLGNLGEVHIEGDVETRDVEFFLRAVSDRVGTEPFMVRQVVEAIRSGEIEPELVPGELGNPWSGNMAWRLGKAFSRWARRRLADDGLRLEFVERERRGHRCLWRVQVDAKPAALKVLP